MGIEPAGEAGQQRGDQEDDDLRLRRIHAHRLGHHRAALERADGAAHARVEQVADAEHGEQDNGPDEVEELLARLQFQPEQIDRRDAGDAGVAAQKFDVAEQVVQADPPGNRAERQVMPAHAQGDEAQRQRDGGGQRQTDAQSQPGREAVARRQPGGRVSAQADEGRLPEGSQAAHAGQQDQTDRDDGVQPDVVEQGDAEFRQHQRCADQQDQEGGDRQIAQPGAALAGPFGLAGRPFFAVLLFLIDVTGSQRAPEQDRNDQREDDHFLEGAGIEGGIGLQQADQNGAEGGKRIGGQTADDGADKALEADQEAGVVVNGGDRGNEHPGKGTDSGGKCQAQLAGQDGRNAHQACPRPVHRRGPQGLAVERTLKEEIEADDEERGRHDHQNGLALQRGAGQFETEIGESRRARPFRTKEQQAEADHRGMHGHRNDEQYQHRGTGQWLVGDAVNHRTHRHDEQQGNNHLQPERQFGGRQGEERRGRKQRQTDIQDEQGGQFAEATVADILNAIHQGDGRTQCEQQPDCAGHLAGLQAGEGQRPVGNEFPLRNENDAGDGEDQHQGKGEKGVDGTVGDAVLAEQKKNLEVHAEPASVKRNADARKSRTSASGGSDYLTSFQVPFSMVTMTRARWSKPW